jgi:hypothetical protein
LRGTLEKTPLQHPINSDSFRELFFLISR